MTKAVPWLCVNASPFSHHQAGHDRAESVTREKNGSPMRNDSKSRDRALPSAA